MIAPTSLDRALLTRVTAALDADPFADPITVHGSTFSRKYARKMERDLIAELTRRGEWRDAA